MITSLFPMLLKQERQRCGWTQDSLAGQLGVARVTISRWESGAIVPSLYWREKLCKHFHKPMDEWFPPVPLPSPAEEHRFLSSEDQQLKRLAQQKKSLKYVIEIADTMIDVLDPQCDERMRSAALERLLGAHSETDALPGAPTLAEVRNALVAAKHAMGSPKQDIPTLATEEAEQKLDERKRCIEVTRMTTPAQLRVLQAFAAGLRPQQVADDLRISLKTVDSHKSVLLLYCYNAWDVSDTERLDYHFLCAKFASFFSEIEKRRS